MEYQNKNNRFASKKNISANSLVALTGERASETESCIRSEKEILRRSRRDKTSALINLSKDRREIGELLLSYTKAKNAR